VGAEVDAWLLLYLLRENDFRNQRIRLVIMGRQKISDRSDNRYGWQKLEQDRGCIFEIEISPFNFQQTAQYLQASGISDPQKIQRIHDITKGWPYYLKEVVKQEQSGNPNLAETEQKLSNFLLPFASDEQKKLVQIASCCRGFNKEILNTIWQILEQTPVSVELHNWLEGLSFIFKQSGIWRFDDVSRDVFRKVLFDDNRQLFERVNQLLADYFYGQSNSYVVTDSPIPRKYRNQDWLRERSSYLYHSFFVRQPDFLQFVTHLLEAHHFQCFGLTTGVVEYINSEASLDRHPQLSSICREFLTLILPVAIGGRWILENPEMVTEESERCSLSGIWQYNSKLSGLSKFVGLYCQASHSDVEETRSFLRAAQQQAEAIKIDSDPEFSSGLFLWEVGNRFSAIDSYEEAIASYDRAVEIKPDKHESWGSRAIALRKLGNYQEAFDSYNQAITIKSDEPQYFHNKGCAYFISGRYPEATNCFEQSIAIKPDQYDSWHDKGLVQFVTSDYAAALATWQQAFKYISDPTVPGYYKDISGLIQEFIEELIPRFTQPFIQQTLLIPLLEIYQEANVITELGAALVNTLHLIIAPAISDHTAAQWLTLWRTSSLGSAPAMELPLRLMETAITKKTPANASASGSTFPKKSARFLTKP
jgi:tetratricopeptide (TPR) repeat protein